MKRRKSKKINVIDELLEQPWQISMLIAVSLFGVAKWLVPVMSDSAMYRPIFGLLSTFGQMFALPFLMVSVASFLKSRSIQSKDSKRCQPVHEQTEPFNNWKEPEPFNDWKDEIEHTVRTPSEPVNIETTWNLDLLGKLEWKRFELLCAEYFRRLGKITKVIEKGADGGIDVRVFSATTNDLELAIQCKAWSSQVGVKEVRELFGVMSHESADKGIFMTTSTFTKDAEIFARQHQQNILLIDGARFISMIRELSETDQSQLLKFATEGDYTTPTCASCGIKMVWRDKGEFWGCSNYPRCNSTLRVKNTRPRTVTK